MGLACTVSIIEYIWKSKKQYREGKPQLQSSMIAHAIMQTNAHMFVVPKVAPGVNGVTVKDLPHNEVCFKTNF